MKKHLPLILAISACGTAPAELATSESAAVDTVNIRRSLVVSNQAILDQRFAMRRVLDQLALQVKNDPTYGGAALFRDWWDTNNDAAHSQGGPLHCDSTLNGFPLQCPRQEGVLASVGLRDSGTDSWTPIALFNRFDLAPEDGANCGEYRIEYGKVGAFPIFDRTLVIFEAQMPNPDPSRGLAGCASIVDFWVKLSAVRNLSTRAGLLETFYFTGLLVDHDGDPATPAIHLPPVISAAHFASGAGQIRSNQFMNLRGYFERGILAQPWQLREHELVPGCPQGFCIEEVMDKNNPFGELFSDDSAHPQKAAFQDFFASASVVEQLAAGDLNLIGMTVPLGFDRGESTSQGTDNDYLAHFNANGPFAARIQSAIAQVPGVTLSPTELVQRATTQSCAGCHQLSNGDTLGGGLVWPNSLVFTHVSETRTRACEPFTLQGRCFVTSEALDGVFLPHRRDVLLGFVAAGFAGASLESIDPLD